MAREGCVCCPYPLLTIPALLSFIALVFIWVAAINCNFFEISWQFTDESGQTRAALLSIGLWTVQSYFDAVGGGGSFCAGWNNAFFASDVQLDVPLKAARAFSMMSACTGTIAFCLLMVPMCVSFGDSHQYLIILCGMCIFTGVATLFDLMALSSDLCKSASSCTLQGAGILAIVGGVLWLMIAGLLFWAMKNPRSFQDERMYVVSNASVPAVQATAVPEPTEKKEIRTIQNGDGSTTKTTTVTVTNADGSKTVTQTTQIIPASPFP